MLECTAAKTLMHLTCILEKEEVSTKVCQKLYRGMIGSLLYLVSECVQFVRTSEQDTSFIRSSLDQKEADQKSF